MKIHIEALRFDAIIGILEHEREHAQPVIIDIEITYRNEEAWIDYAKVTELVEKTVKKEKFGLLEEALETVADTLHDHFPAISVLYLKIAKPQIFPHCNVAISNVFTYKA